MNILVTDTNSMLGSEIKKRVSAFPQWNFHFIDLQEFYLHKFKKFDAFIYKNKISCIINCAAYADVNKAEHEGGKAYWLNAYALKDLAICANQYGLKFIHVSTDFVFNGSSHRPYTEVDQAAPVNQYGKSKLAGERIIQVLCPKAVIVRTSWLYSSATDDSIYTIWGLAKMHASMLVVCDLFGCPTWTRDLAITILEMLDDEQTGITKTGIFHYAGEGVASNYDFAKEIVRLSGQTCKITPISSEDYPELAKRPAFSVLSKEKIKTEFGISIPHWRDSIKKCFEEIMTIDEAHSVNNTNNKKHLL